MQETRNLVTGAHLLERGPLLRAHGHPVGAAVAEGAAGQRVDGNRPQAGDRAELGVARIVEPDDRIEQGCAALLDARAGPGVGEPCYAPPPHGHLFADADAELLFERLMAFMPSMPIFNCTGNPAITLPLYWNDDGLPVGVHFGGRIAGEATLFRLAAQLEEARPWRAPSGQQRLVPRLAALL